MAAGQAATVADSHPVEVEVEERKAGIEVMADLLITAFLQLLVLAALLLGSVLYLLTGKWGLHLHIMACQSCNYDGCRRPKEIEDNNGDGDGLCHSHCERFESLPSSHSAKARQRRSVKRKACRGDDEEERGSETERLRKLLRIEEETRNALNTELEKERNAAASAADAAMAMILRLQREKASVQMESRQFRRMVEQKQIHDQQAIQLLKDIVVNQEGDKFALRKQLELCRVRPGQRQGNDFDLNDFNASRFDADAEHGPPGDLPPVPPDYEVRSQSPSPHTKSVIVEEDEQSMKKDTMRVQESEEVAQGKPAEQQQFLACPSPSSQMDMIFFKKFPSVPCGVHQSDSPSADVSHAFHAHVCC